MGSDKERVLAKWPDAVAEKMMGKIFIYRTKTSSFRVGIGNTPEQALADAASRAVEYVPKQEPRNEH